MKFYLLSINLKKCHLHYLIIIFVMIFRRRSILLKYWNIIRKHPFQNTEKCQCWVPTEVLIALSVEMLIIKGVVFVMSTKWNKRKTHETDIQRRSTVHSNHFMSRSVSSLKQDSWPFLQRRDIYTRILRTLN